MLDDVTKELSDAAKGFKQMQIALLVFAALSGIAIILVSIKILKG